MSVNFTDPPSGEIPDVPATFSCPIEFRTYKPTPLEEMEWEEPFPEVEGNEEETPEDLLIRLSDDTDMYFEKHRRGEPFVDLTRGAPSNSPYQSHQDFLMFSNMLPYLCLRAQFHGDQFPTFYDFIKLKYKINDEFVNHVKFYLETIDLVDVFQLIEAWSAHPWRLY